MGLVASLVEPNISILEASLVLAWEPGGQAVLFPADRRIKSAGNLVCPTGNLADLSRSFFAISEK